MKKILTIMFVVMMMLAVIPTNALNASASAGSSASGMCVLEAGTGKVLYEKNKDKQLTCASTTKIVTAITVLDNCKDLGELITVDNLSVGISGTSIYLKKGEQIKVIDLLYGLMLRSGNDAAMALAIHTAGSKELFATMMNETAKKCGATNSSFMNPHGLDELGHYTTAYDLAKITAYALANDYFKELVSTKNYKIESTNSSEIRYLRNKNRLLDTLDGCIGVKTGFTNKAGRCLVSATERDNLRLVCVVLNCGPMFEESVALLNGGNMEYESKLLVEANTQLYSKPVFDSKNNMLYVYAKENVNYPVKKGEDDSNFEYIYNIQATHNVAAGAEIGSLEIMYKNQLIKSVKLYTINSIDILEKKDILNNITGDWVA